MNTTLNAAVASERQHKLIDEAAAYRRSHKAGHRRSHRVASFLKDLTSASR
jgi:hypothetical protein